MADYDDLERYFPGPLEPEDDEPVYRVHIDDEGRIGLWVGRMFQGDVGLTSTEPATFDISQLGQNPLEPGQAAALGQLIEECGVVFYMGTDTDQSSS